MNYNDIKVGSVIVPPDERDDKEENWIYLGEKRNKKNKILFVFFRIKENKIYSFDKNGIIQNNRIISFI